MAASQNVELEAAKFLHKLIQESRDEPAKLATKLYVVCSESFTSYLVCSINGTMIFHMYDFILLRVSDTATHEIKWERAFDAISSNFEVKNYCL